MNKRLRSFISKSHVASLLGAIALLIVLPGLSGCMMPFLTVMDSLKDSASSDSPAGGGGGSGTIEPLMVNVYGPEFMLAWDAPNGSEVQFYRLYYRERGAIEWSELGSSDTEELSFEVNSDTLPAGYGHYEFAVQSVDSEGTASEYHTSVSETAQPSTGWYVHWQPAL